MKLILITIVSYLMILCSANSAQSVIVTAEPDDFPDGTRLNNAFPGITLEGPELSIPPPYSVYVEQSGNYVSTGTKNFGDYPNGSAFTVYFHNPTNYFSIDMIAGGYDASSGDPGAAWLVYDGIPEPGYKEFSWDNLVNPGLSTGEVYNVEVNLPSNSISSLKIWADNSSTVGVDNLRYNLVTVVPEPISSTLFVMGAGLLAVRRYLRRKK